MDENSIKVVRVTTTEFELSDGRVYEHPIPLEYEEVPLPEAFQEFYDYWLNIWHTNHDKKTPNYIWSLHNLKCKSMDINEMGESK